MSGPDKITAYDANAARLRIMQLNLEDAAVAGRKLAADLFAREREIEALRERLAGEVTPYLTALDVAMETLRQIESTPRNAGARRNARATLRFIETNLTKGGAA